VYGRHRGSRRRAAARSDCADAGRGGGSIQIFELPFTLTIANFPYPGIDSCGIGEPEEAGTVLTCAFQNVTGQTISLLDFRFTLPQDSGELSFEAQDPDNLFGNEDADENGARFAGGGILSGSCGGGELESSLHCTGGHFFIDFVGFPRQTSIAMTASQVPEPATLTLFATALAVAGGARGRRRKAPTSSRSNSVAPRG
jgi:hypothetical protein